MKGFNWSPSDDDEFLAMSGSTFSGSANGMAAHPSRRPRRGTLRMRSYLLKHNNLMVKSERRERLETWAASDHRFHVITPGPMRSRTDRRPADRRAAVRRPRRT